MRLFVLNFTGLLAWLLSVNMNEFPLVLNCTNQVIKTIKPGALD